VDSGEETVVHITGSGLKNPQYLRPNGNASTVRADLSEVERALSGR
jgi:threonine synthase